MSTCKKVGVVLTVAAATALSASAAILVSDDGTGWSVASAIPPNPVATTINAQGQSSVHGSAIPVVTPNSGVQLTGGTTAGLFDDLIYESAQLGTIAGSSITGVNFDFLWSSGPALSKLSIYFDTGDAYTWYYDITPPGSGWQNTSVLTSAGGWYSTDGGTVFATSLAAGNLTAAGIRVLYANNALNEYYGLANYQLQGGGVDPGAIPEPGTYMMLSTALMSLGFTFARRRAARKTA